MFLNSLKPLLNVKIKNSSNIFNILNPYKSVLRFFKSNPDPCSSKPILMEPDCRSVVITGVGGIGYATAHQLLCENARRVALIGTDTKRGAEVVNTLNCSFGKERSIFFKCDIKNKTEVEDTMKKIKVELEDIDIVVNTTGMWNDLKYLEEMHTNLGGTLNVNLAAKDQVERGSSVIINIAGFTGLDAFPMSSPFAAFASGIIHFSRSFGHDMNFKRFGIRVVALCVGLTQTNLLNDLHTKMLTKEMGKELGDYLKKACGQKPDACAKAVVELIKFGPSGSVWLVEGSRLFYYDVPDYKPYLNLISQFV